VSYRAWVAISAYVFVSTTNPGPRAAYQAIRRLKGVMRADALFGGPPVVAMVEGADVAGMDAVVDQIVELPMVTDTQTYVRDIADGWVGRQGGLAGQLAGLKVGISTSLMAR
jgi:Lrp/AsnC ligand binding domain